LRILLSSHAFAPSVGGIESVSAILAREWSKSGHVVRITTETPGEATWEGIPVLRSPGRKALRNWIADADLYFQNHISLRSLLPALGLGKQIAVLHQTYLWPWDQRAGFAGWGKWLVSRRLRNLAISKAVAAHLPAGTPVVGNPYDASTFKVLPDIRLKKEFLFVGRFVSDKGVGLLLEAMRRLRVNHPEAGSTRLTLVGGGPEESNLRRIAADAGLSDLVTFAGPLAGDALAQMYNAHRILVVPSTWPEPFGIVALEGAACGCFVVASSAGGLPEAVGPAGDLFDHGNVDSLANALKRALSSGRTVDGEAVEQHLSTMSPGHYASKVLRIAYGGTPA
jgi:glycogen(starch) synthase